MAQAHLVVAHTIRNQRTASAFMEPRSAIGSYDPARALHVDIRLPGCASHPPPAGALPQRAGGRVRALPDVGGAFGSRTNLYPEQVAVSWAARRLGCPVKWTADRSEAFLTDYTARDVVTKARLAFDRRGRMLALALVLTANIGAHTVSYVPLSNGYRVAPTVYDVPLACIRLRGVMTNTVPTAPFRGAGRPEATAVMERLVDLAARLRMTASSCAAATDFTAAAPGARGSWALMTAGISAAPRARVEMATEGFAARRRAARKRTAARSACQLC